MTRSCRAVSDTVSSVYDRFVRMIASIRWRHALQVGTATAALLTATLLTSGSSQLTDERQKYSESLLVARFARNPAYSKYSDGRQQLAYTAEIPYPADELLSFIKTELRKRGWKPLSESFFNPGTPSSIKRGWLFVEDHTQQPWTGSYGWGADWQDSSHDITEYELQYKSPDHSTRDLKQLQLIALFIPANITTKMKRSVSPGQ
jgi:hypothetical protein